MVQLMVSQTVSLQFSTSSSSLQSYNSISGICRMVDKAHLLDYATHEVPLPLFGLDHDWAHTFCGALLPHCAQAWAPELTLWGISTLIRLWSWMGRHFPELRGRFHWQIVVLLPCILWLWTCLNISLNNTARIQPLYVTSNSCRSTITFLPT